MDAEAALVGRSVEVDVEAALVGRSVEVDAEAALVGRSVEVDVEAALVGRSVEVDAEAALVGRSVETEDGDVTSLVVLVPTVVVTAGVVLDAEVDGLWLEPTRLAFGLAAAISGISVVTADVDEPA